MADKTPEQMQAEESEKAARAEEKRVARHMDADEFVVVAPYVTLKMRDDAGGTVMRGMLEGGGFSRDDVDEANLRHHVETGLVAAKDSDEAEYAGPAGTPKPGEPPNVPVEETGDPRRLPAQERLAAQQEAAQQAERQAARPDGQPAPYAAKTAWVDYAVSCRADGVSEEDARREAEGMSKADLIRTHGGTPAADDTES